MGESCVKYVLVKNLVTGRMRRVEASNLFVVNVDSYEYSPFVPKSVEDFEKKKYYGEIIEDQMVLNYILAMSESEEEIRKMFEDPRKYHIPNPKRYSTSPASELLKKYTLVKEKSDCLIAKSIKKRSDAVSKQALQKKIIEKFNKKSDKVQPLKESKTKTDATAKQGTQDMEQSATHLPGKRSSTVAALDDGNSSSKMRKAELVVCGECPSLKLKVKALEEFNSALEFKVKALEDVNSVLKAELQKKEDSVASLQLRMTDLDRINTALQEKVNIFQSKEDSVNQLKAALTETIQGAISNTGCGLAKLGTVESNETDCVDCGLGIIVKKTDVAEKEFKSEKLSTRLRGLCELFWGEKLHEMHLTYEPDKAGSVIENVHITSLTSLLNTMKWGKDELLEIYSKAFPNREKPFTLEEILKTGPITKQIVRCALRQITYNARVRHDNSLMTKEERLAEKAKKEDKKKDQKKDEEKDEKKDEKKDLPKKKNKKRRMAEGDTGDVGEKGRGGEKDGGEEICSEDKTPETIEDEDGEEVVFEVKGEAAEGKEGKTEETEFIFTAPSLEEADYSESDTSLVQDSPHK